MSNRIRLISLLILSFFLITQMPLWAAGLSAEQLLNLRYGKWKTPKKNYNYESEDGTIFKKDVCPLCGCFTKPYLFGGYKCSSCSFKLD